MYQPQEGDWPSCVRESGIDEYQELSLQRWRLLSATNIRKAGVFSLSFSKSCVIFHVGVTSGTNFFHFLIDHLPRLLLILERINEPVVVMCQDTSVGFINQYLGLIEKYFSIELYKFENDNYTHIRITSDLILISDVSRRLRYSAKQFETIFQRAKTDPQLEALGIQFGALVPKKFKDHQVIHHWIRSDTNQVLKQSSGMFEHSLTAMDSLYRFGQTVIAGNANEASKHHDVILVTRDNSKSSQRFLENEQELISSIGEIAQVDFAELSVIEQIVVANNCRVMVGVTGAGLANAVYMEPGGLVIDITPLGYYLPAVDMIEELCRIRTLCYVRVFSTPLDDQGTTTVEVDLVKRSLEEHGLPGAVSAKY